MTATVLHLVHRLTAGGAERVLVNLINGSSEKTRHIVCSLSPADAFGDEISADKRIIINLDKKPGNDFKIPFKIAAICRQYSVDVVHAQGWATYVEGIIAAKFLCWGKKPSFIFAFRGKTIEDVAGIPWKRIFAQKFFSKFCESIITPSSEMKQDYAKTIGIPPAKIQVIHNGVRIAQRCADHETLSRTEFGIPDDAVVVGCVARLDPVKNLVWLVGALAPLLQNTNDLYLLIIGDGPEMENIKREVYNQGLTENVHLAGRRSDISACLCIMDIFIQPSVYEGISNTILEAMACSLPVVATNVGGTPEIVTDGITGILVESQSAKQLYAAVEKLLSDPLLRHQMGHAGQRSVEQQFTLTRMANSYEKLFLELKKS